MLVRVISDPPLRLLETTRLRPVRVSATDGAIHGGIRREHDHSALRAADAEDLAWLFAASGRSPRLVERETQESNSAIVARSSMASGLPANVCKAN
jgi:hypothetical protein